MNDKVIKLRELNAYLIQRGTFDPSRTYKKGIDSIISFDYMGAAEFEFGVLGESLGRIRELKSEYIYEVIRTGNHSVTVFHNQNRSTLEITNYLTKLNNNEFHLHEWTNFPEFVKDPRSTKTNFWWDIKMISCFGIIKK